MFSEPHTKISDRLPYIFHIRVRAGKPVNARVFEVIVITGIILVTQEFACSVLCFIGYTEVCMSEKICDKTSFFSCVGKGGKFLSFRLL